MPKKVFLYDMTAKKLKEKIFDGTYPPGSLLPSEREIGETYNVDRTTVRKALQVLVNESLVEKKAGKGTVVKDLNNTATFPTKESENTPDPLQKTGIYDKEIAFFLPRNAQNSDRIRQPFYSQLFYVIQEECQKLGFSLIYLTLDEDDDLKKILNSRRFSGVFFVSNVSKQHLSYAIEKKIPAVLINSFHPEMPSVLSDNFQGAYQACKELIKKGHKKIVIIKGEENYTTNKERLRGSLSALREFNIPIQSSYILGENSWEFDDGFKVMKNFLQTANQLPTAVFAFNDRLALGAMQAIQQAGLNVPKDISIIGYDNSEQSKLIYPRLSSIEINVSIMGSASVFTLLQQMNYYQALPIKILIPIQLIKRDSITEIK